MIEVQRQHSVHVITLARPDQRNALTPQMSSDLLMAIRAVPSDCNAILLCGKGRMFCSGFDLVACRDSKDRSVVASLLTSLAECVAALRGSELPVAIAAQGGAIAGGCALLTAADSVVADRAALFGYPVLRLGLSPAVSIPTLSDRIGTGASRTRALDTALATAADAAACGLVDEIVPEPEQVFEAALAQARALGGKPSGALRAIREFLRRAAPIAEADLADGLTVSLESARSVQHGELLDAALQRRRD